MGTSRRRRNQAVSATPSATRLRLRLKQPHRPQCINGLQRALADAFRCIEELKSKLAASEPQDWGTAFKSLAENEEVAYTESASTK